jgi:N-methylhydantoinase A
MTHLRVAVDVGGTFTDACVFDERSGSVAVTKAPSTPDPIDGVLAALRLAGVDLREVAFFAHGTTVATNALLTRRLPRTALVSTRGFRDVIEIRRGTREHLWDHYRDPSPPYIPRRDRLVVDERIDYSGRVLRPLDEQGARELARTLGRRAVQSVAVCFVNAYANPAHELRMCELLREELPDAHIAASSEVLPEIFEHERFSTTVVSAVLAPVVGGYVRRMEARLQDGGYAGELLMLHSGGGVITAQAAARYAGRLAGSGIAAGAIAARELAARGGFRDAIGFDMGGTSTDVSLLTGGELLLTKEWAIEYGHPIAFPSIDVKTIGAGGGSLAWVDEGGSLRSGPASAGSLPGPACYGLGGELPTTTDANLLLGRLAPTLLGGRLTLDPSAAREAVRRTVAEPLGLSVEDAAAAVLDVADAHMADAIRLVSIAKGHDPRDFALVAFGGAGPLHAVHLARELAIPTVLVPPHPGVTSALGCLLVDVRHDLSAMVIAAAGELSREELEDAFTKLERAADERLCADGFAPAQRSLQRTVELRYAGQWRSLAVPVPAPLPALEQIVAAFHEAHEREHAYMRPDTPVEIFRVGLSALGRTPKVELRPALAGRASTPDHPGSTPVTAGAAPPLAGGERSPAARREVRFAGERGWVSAAVVDRATLALGDALDGPAVIEQLDSTTLLPPGSRAVSDERGNLRIEVAL